MHVITPKELEERCQIPVLLGTLIGHLVFAPVKILALFSLFLRIDRLFNPNRVLFHQRVTKRK